MGVLATVVEGGAVDDGLYGFLLWLHIVLAIFGFGAVVLNGLYGAEAKKRPGPGGLAISQANLAVGKVGEYLIYGVFVVGILLVFAAEDDTIEFGDTWVWLSILLYVIAIGFSHGVQQRNAKQMVALAEELNAGPPPAGAQGPPPQVAQMEELGKKLAAGGAFLNLMLLAIIYLMVFKPGWP